MPTGAHIPYQGKVTELACYLARETALVNEVICAGKARYSDKERSFTERIWVVPRRELFVPDVDEGFFVFLDTSSLPAPCAGNDEAKKEARMKSRQIFWKQGPLLAGLLYGFI